MHRVQRVKNQENLLLPDLIDSTLNLVLFQADSGHRDATCKHTMCAIFNAQSWSHSRVSTGTLFDEAIFSRVI